MPPLPHKPCDPSSGKACLPFALDELPRGVMCTYNNLVQALTLRPLGRIESLPPRRRLSPGTNLQLAARGMQVDSPLGQNAYGLEFAG